MEKKEHSLYGGIKEQGCAELTLRPPFPKKIKLELTNLCNHKCIFCVQNKLTAPRGVITKEFSADILKQAYDLGAREVGYFIHGEPFVCQDLAWHVAKAKEIGYDYVFITTNGSLATPERFTAVVQAGMDSIKFSVNAGSKETYLRIHGRDDYEQVLKNLKFISDYRKKNGCDYKIFMSSILTIHTEDEVDEIKRIFSPLVDELAFYKARGCGGLMPENDELVKGFTPIQHCLIPFNTAFINYDGALFACDNDANNTFQIADLNNERLDDAWNSDTFRLFRKMHLEGKLASTKCQACLASGGGQVNVVMP